MYKITLRNPKTGCWSRSSFVRGTWITNQIVIPSCETHWKFKPLLSSSKSRILWLAYGQHSGAITVQLLEVREFINRPVECRVECRVVVKFIIDLDGGLMVDLYGVLFSIFMVCYCRSLWQADCRSCRVIVNHVEWMSILVGYLSIIMSKITVARYGGLNVQLRGRVHVYINWAWPYCNTLCSLAHPCWDCIWSLLPSNSVRLTAAQIGPRLYQALVWPRLLSYCLLIVCPKCWH